MTVIKSPTTLEKIVGGLPAEAALTAVAAAVGTPLSALLPVLGKTLAAERQKARVEATLREINDILVRHEADLHRLTDQQYKFINEAVLALLHTTNEGKLELLKDVVRNSLLDSSLVDQEAVFLSRIIRDISAEEVRFLLNNFSFQRIWLSDLEAGERDIPTLAVKSATPDGRAVLGLFTLGLVAPAEPTFDDMGLMKFTPMAAKLIALLKMPAT